ncbi:hypothetical protein ACFYNW_34085 [Streptomyces virginiae]|uniref:hypothetical protein n=1 Tax=Streptomyces virginiae TaxID=1961 RepID=UPI0036F16540
MESPILHQDTSATVAELQPGVQCTVISAQDAALQPTPAPGSVLAVHADLLRDPAVRVPLLVLAHATDHLLVARHDYSDPTLDSLAGPAHRLDYAAFTAAANKDFTAWAEAFAPTYVPPPIEQREGRVARQGAAAGDQIGFTDFVEYKQRLIEQLNRRPADGPLPDNVEYIDLEALPHTEIDLDRIAAEAEAFAERSRAARRRAPRPASSGGPGPRRGLTPAARTPSARPGPVRRPSAQHPRRARARPVALAVPAASVWRAQSTSR